VWGSFLYFLCCFHISEHKKTKTTGGVRGFWISPLSRRKVFCVGDQVGCGVFLGFLGGFCVAFDQNPFFFFLFFPRGVVFFFFLSFLLRFFLFAPGKVFFLLLFPRLTFSSRGSQLHSSKGQSCPVAFFRLGFFDRSSFAAWIA